MAERGARPKVPRVQRRLLDAIGALTTPLLPDDYLELINPLWSTRELRGRIESIDHETPDAATVLIRPGYRWEGHAPGQYLRVGLDIKGRRHWRAYSLTSDPQRPDGCISITVKHVDEGVVSPYLVKRGRPGSIISLGGVEGDFVLPEQPAGAAAVRLRRLGHHADHEHAPQPRAPRRARRRRAPALRARRRRRSSSATSCASSPAATTGSACTSSTPRHSGRLAPADLDRLCEDWREREAYVSGPGEMLDALDEHWDERTATASACTWSASSPSSAAARRARAARSTSRSPTAGPSSDGSKPILVAGEEAGLELPFGCREGICHTCVGTLRSGRVRDLRTGKVTGSDGETVRTCIHAPEGPIEIEL